VAFQLGRPRSRPFSLPVDKSGSSTSRALPDQKQCRFAA
jgi:hypothetical protein